MGPGSMLPEELHPDDTFVKALESGEAFQAEACFHCRKCTNGCPVTFAMDLVPDEVIRLVILGQRERVLSCRTIWVCAACETCTTRCPNEVKIAELMDRLKEMSIREGIPCPRPQVRTLHETFLKNVKKRGRVFESTLLPAYLLRSGRLQQKWRDGTWRAEAALGRQMLKKGRMPLRSRKIKGKKEVRRILKGIK